MEISRVDESMTPIPGTEQIIDCDALILSVGLIPENELAETLGVSLSAATKGPICDGQLMSSQEGIFSCGNALHVNDLVDYVSESGELAGKNAALYRGQSRDWVDVHAGKELLYCVPQKLNLQADNSGIVLYFRSRDVLNDCRLTLTVDGKEVFAKKYRFLRPPEMERLTLDFSSYGIRKNSDIRLEIEVKDDD